MENTRPVGLKIFAIINFVLCGTITVGFVFGLIQQASNVDLNLHSILSPIITALLLLLSGIGFLKQKYILGFICGIIFCIGAIANILIYSAVRNFNGFSLQVTGMVYPTVLLFFLIIRYRKCFIREEIMTEQNSAGEF